MVKNKETEKSVSIRFPIDLLTRIAEQAQTDGRSINRSVVKACIVWLESKTQEKAKDEDKL